MWNWLKSIWNGFTGGIDDLYHWVLQIIQTIYSYIDNEITDIWQGAMDLYDSISVFANSILNWTESELNALSAYLARLYDDLISWVSQNLAAIINDIQSVIAWAAQQVSNILNYVTSFMASMTRWIVQDIWTPLYNWVSSALQWIENEGIQLWNLITHPDRLARYIGAYLLKAWMDLARTLAKPFASWILHSMLSAGEFAGGILEDMISAIL